MTRRNDPEQRSSGAAPRVVGDTLTIGTDCLILPHGVGQILRQLQQRNNQVPLRLGLSADSNALMIEDPTTNRAVLLPTQDWPPARPFSQQLNFSFAKPGMEIRTARSLLAQAHPLGNANGVHLTVRFSETDEQEEIRQHAAAVQKEDSWSSAWFEPPGRVVGVAVISRLFHSNPLGREYVAKAIGSTDLVGELQRNNNRRDAVKLLGLVWLSRIAISAPYRRIGLGGALVREALSAVQTLPWFPNAVEVMRTLPYDDSRKNPKEPIEQLLRGDVGDFLTRNGYTIAPLELTSEPVQHFSRNGEPIPGRTTAKKLYYYAILPGSSVD